MIREVLQKENLVHKNFRCFLLERFCTTDDAHPLYLNAGQSGPFIGVGIGSLQYKYHLLLYLDAIIYDHWDEKLGWVVYKDFVKLTYDGINYTEANLLLFLRKVLKISDSEMYVKVYFEDSAAVDDIIDSIVSYTFSKPG
jgi:hypothetical protein